MLVDLKRMVAYICPFCSNISTKMLSIFRFSGTEKVNLICPTHGCHETCVTITPKNSKYKINIECPLCGGTHLYTVSKETFWQKPLISYKCPVSGIETFFAGEPRRVEQALDEYSDIYSDIIDESEDFLNENDPFNIVFAILERLNRLQEKHLISCVCGSTDAEFDIEQGDIIMRCCRCGRTKKIKVSEETLTRILNTNAIIIDN